LTSGEIRPSCALRRRDLRVVRELDTGNDDPEMHFTVLVVEPF
jgi:hypothetical protein